MDRGVTWYGMVWQSEMVLCDTLVSYLETTFMKGSADAPKVSKVATQITVIS